MNKLLLLSFLITFSCCGQQTKYKKTSEVILKECDSLRLNLYIDFKSKKEVLLQGEFANISKSEFQFYKYIFPNENNCQDLFQIVNMKDLEPLKYIGKNQYLEYHNKLDDYCYEPIVKKENFFTIPSNEFASFKINLANYYDFSRVDDKDEFGILYMLEIPFIVNDNHIFEVDKIDKKSKPVYYWMRYLNNLKLTRITFTQQLKK